MILRFCLRRACVVGLWSVVTHWGHAAEGQLASSLFVRVAQSSDAASTNVAARALDGTNGTFSLTTNGPGSWWTAELGRPYPLTRVEVVNRPSTPAEMAGLTLRLFNMDDQVVFQTTLTNPGSGGTNVLSLPAGLRARSVWIGLLGTQTNGGGNYRVGLAEVRAFGLLNMPYGPEPVSGVRVWQSSDLNSSYPATKAVDGDTSANNFTHTGNYPDSSWMADLGQVLSLDRIEIVNRSSCCAERLANLVLRVFDGSSNTVSSAVLVNVGLGGSYTHTLPSGTQSRWIRVGLENGQTNGGGNYYVTVAELRAFSGTTNVLLAGSTPVTVTNNLASFKTSCMLRLTSSVPAASNANDDNFTTETKTTTATVDGYWEVDLGATYALYGVRSIAASGISYRLTNTTVRLYDAAHESVFAQKVSGTPDTFDTDLSGPVFARYVRVGLEDKQRTDPAGGIEWYIGFREVEVFGRPTNNVGILSFSASTNHIASGQNVTLSWNVDDVRRVEIHPALGSVGAYTATNGVGNITVAVGNSTEFVLVASNAAGIFSRAVSVQVASHALPVRLSEIVAENKYSLKDGYGDASDWIELRNTANTNVNLAGWGLSDNPANPMKWVFPSTNIAAHGTLTVFASGRETPFDPAGNLHADFRLEKNGGAVVLTASNGVTTVDILAAYPEQDTDLAYGRDLEGNWTFLEPTPNAVNAAATYLGWLKQLDWSHARGFYETGFTLTLTNNSPGATVLYSIDGSVPTLSYTTNLAITGTKSVRAQVVRPGYKATRIQTKTFLFLNYVITSPVMNTAITQDPSYAPRMKPGLLALPSVSICVPGAPEYWEQEGSLEILWPNGADPVQVNCGIMRYGNAWTKFAKRSIRMKCRSRYGDANFSAPLLNGFDRGVVGKTSFDELDFRSGSQDMSERGFYMAGRFVEDSMLDMGSLNPHGRFVHVYLNGVYWGQYDCRELLVEHFMADYLGGQAEDYVVVRGNDNVGDNFALGAPEPPNILPWERALSFRSSYNSVRPYVDVSHLFDFMLLWNYGNCESEYRSCGPLNAGTGFKFWIADADGFLRTSANGLNRTVRNGPGDLVSGLIAENNSDFKTLLADRIYKHFFNNGALTPAANDARLAARMNEIRDSLLAECARWTNRTPANWESSAATIRSSLFPTRTSELLGYLRGAGWYPSFDPPTINQYGGLATNGFQPQCTSTDGTIYYTLNGSDPRVAGGGLATNALIWTPGALTITQEITLTLRVRTAGGLWSALAQPRFWVAPRVMPTSRDLLITEICYNPAGSDEYEFIELHNASTNQLDLSGVSVSNAVRFIFTNGTTLAPGAFLLVVESTNSFAARFQTPSSLYYWTNLSVAGQWSGALDNAGETVTLLASNGVELSSVPYKDGGDWPERPNGGGSSLELSTLPAATNSDAAVRAFVADGRNWTASDLFHGSPGRFDSFVKSVRINEVLSHSNLGDDWVELLNTGAQPVNLSGCSLTDNVDLPNRYVFATNTILQPGQFLVLSSTQLVFGLSEMGDDLSLFQLSGTNALRFLDSVDFTAAEREEPFGLFLRSDGQQDFTELRAITPGAANALPRVGPVVFSEIMSRPGTNHAEFLELTVITNAPVPMFDPARPTNLWIIEGVGNFTFPTGTVLEPYSTVIVCATNPADFRAQYGLSPSIPVFGPWTGALDGNGETLKLLRPGDPQPDGTVPYYRVDHVTYRTIAPWAQTGAGVSLERIPLQAYGNDPAYWRASVTNGTPGVPCSNRPPIINLTGDLAINEAEPLSLALSAADLDAPWQTLTLTPLVMPDGSSFNPGTGTFSWTPTEAQGPGSHPVSFSVTDDGAPNLGATTNFNILVIEVNLPPALPYFSNRVALVNVPISLSAAATDADVPAQTLHYHLEPGAPSGASIHPDTGLFTWTPSVPQCPSTNTITVGVDDGIETTVGSFIVTVPDTIPPTITFLTNALLNAAANCQAPTPNLTSASFIIATDNGGSVTVTQSVAVGTLLGLGTNWVVLGAFDAAGNLTRVTNFVCVVDQTPPAITCPGNITVPTEPGRSSRSNVTYAATAIDSCAITKTACVPASGSTFSLGVTVVTCTATDASGNSAQCTFTVTVTDTENPRITCPADLLFSKDPGQSTKSNVLFSPTASDNATVTNVACVPPSGSTFPLGINPVTCTATDSSGNIATCNFTVTIVSDLVSKTNEVVNLRIPDGTPLGLVNAVNVSSPIERITGVNATLNVTGGFNGDLHAYLVHDSGHAVLLNRAGKTLVNPSGYSDAGFNLKLSDSTTNGDLHRYRMTLFGNPNTPLAGPLTRTWAPDGRDTDPTLVLDSDSRTALLSSFNGLNPNGRWTLFIADVDAVYASTLVDWGLELQGTNALPTVTASPQSRTNLAWTEAVFNVTATGLSALGYQWYFGPAPVPSATNATLTLPSVQPTNAGDYQVVVTSLGGSVTSQVATLTVQTRQVSGLLVMEEYVGPSRQGYGTRDVVFKASDNSGSVLATWTAALSFTPGADGIGVASFSLDNVPPATHLSAKTAWHLRKRLPINFVGRFATVNFTGTFALAGGDLDGSNLVNLADYSQLASAWYSANPAADIDGSGFVDSLDYFILSNHWLLPGDPE